MGTIVTRNPVCQDESSGCCNPLFTSLVSLIYGSPALQICPQNPHEVRSDGPPRKRLIIHSAGGAERRPWAFFFNFFFFLIVLLQNNCFTILWWFLPPINVAGGSDGKESSRNSGDLGSITGRGRSPGKGIGNPLQYSCMENAMERGA